MLDPYTVEQQVDYRDLILLFDIILRSLHEEMKHNLLIH